jgi:hypothetical protein
MQEVEMNRQLKYLVIQTNSEGRPCGWGKSADKPAAEAEAARQYGMHGYPEGEGCYPGEARGRLFIHKLWEPIK